MERTLHCSMLRGTLAPDREALELEANLQLERLCPLSLLACRSVHDKDGEINECLKELFKRSGLQDGVACTVHVAKVIEGTGADIHTDPVLNNACAVDLRKFCRDVSPGEGRMFACLVTVSKEKNFSLEKECWSVLSKASMLWITVG